MVVRGVVIVSRFPAPAARLVTLALLGWAVVVAGLGSPAQAESEQSARVLATEVSAAITPVVADQVAAGLDRANGGGFTAYVIELDTPGGLATAMRDIVQGILASEVPVVVYVSPDGARAASAGAVITYASHVAVMAPGTTIGAATPVGMQGEDLGDKIVNDAASQARALAELRGRDVDFAVESVTDGRSVSVEEAVDLGVVDGVATDLAGALDVADGRTVTVVGDQRVTVDTAGAAVVREDMGFFRSVLQFLADPNIAFLLLTLGTLGLIYELATPGIGVAGVTGATALLLALFSLSVLPVNVVGVLLLVVAIGLFVAELFVPGIGGFAFGGAAVLVLASAFLFDEATGVSVDLWAALPVALVMFGAAILAGRLAHRTRHQRSSTTGADLLLDRDVVTQGVAGTTGHTFAAGAWWTVRSTGGPIRDGGTARVVGIDGLTLLVEPADQTTPPTETSATGRDDHE
jgi:membrane-bound serine protease (ClpP class)